MKYIVKGTLEIRIYCDCPNCGGDDVHYDGEQVELEVEANDSKDAKDIALKSIWEEMEHENFRIRWYEGLEVIEVKAEIIGADVQLLKLGATPLFSLEGILKK